MLDMKLPQLHLRDLFWLVLVAGLAVGWWANRDQLLAVIAVAENKNHFGVQGELYPADLEKIVSVVGAATAERILLIQVIQLGEVRVSTGQVRGMLDGRGSIFTLQKSNGEWRIVLSGIWMS